MNLIYNSDAFYVVQYPPHDTPPEPKVQIGSFEIVDKTSRRELYLDGEMAEVFRKNVEELMQKSPSVEEIDAFLDDLCSFSTQRLTLQ